MIAYLLLSLTLVSAIGCGLVGGIFLAFSSFVMSALGRLAPEQGIAAMQSINITVLNPLFLGLFMGTGGLCILLIILGALRWHEPGTLLVLAGAVLYILGTIAVTMICNVPMNEVLAAAEPGSTEAARLWRGYLQDWTMWNHVRTIAAMLAAIALAIGFRQLEAVG
jgi:uncharacterized membrane protein